jgi:hypothetical protein
MPSWDGNRVFDEDPPVCIKAPNCTRPTAMVTLATSRDRTRIRMRMTARSCQKKVSGRKFTGEAKEEKQEG